MNRAREHFPPGLRPVPCHHGLSNPIPLGVGVALAHARSSFSAFARNLIFTTTNPQRPSIPFRHVPVLPLGGCPECLARSKRAVKILSIVNRNKGGKGAVLVWYVGFGENMEGKEKKKRRKKPSATIKINEEHFFFLLLGLGLASEHQTAPLQSIYRRSARVAKRRWPCSPGCSSKNGR